MARVHNRRRPDELRGEPNGRSSPARDLCRAYIEMREAGGLTRYSPHKISDCSQSEHNEDAQSKRAAAGQSVLGRSPISAARRRFGAGNPMAKENEVSCRVPRPAFEHGKAQAPNT